MAHEITDADNFGETRNGGKRAWHGLGIEIPEGLTAVEALPKVGLDWETELAPVYAEYEGQRIELPEHKLHLRKDTRAKLGLVSDGYKPIDNGDLARFADMLLGEDAALTVETAGSLHGGRRIFLLLRIPGSIAVTREDLVSRYICISNGHGGFASCNGYPTTVRVVCQNTLTMSEKDMRAGFRFFHTGDMEAKLKQARLILGFAHKELTKFEEQAKALVAINLSVGQTRDFMEMAFTESFGRIPDRDDDAETHDKLVAKRSDLIGTWLANLENEKNSLPTIVGTAWAAYNAVSEWHDHERGRFLGVDKSNARVHSNLFGEANKAKNKVFRAALTLA